MLILEGWNKPNQRMHSPLQDIQGWIAEFFEDHSIAHDVMVYGPHRVGRKRLKGKFACVSIVLTILNDRKRSIILDSSKVYLKGTIFF